MSNNEPQDFILRLKSYNLTYLTNSTRLQNYNYKYILDKQYYV